MGINTQTRILLVEDNPSFGHLVDILLRDMGITQIKVARNYEEGTLAFDQFQPNICILDIDLGVGLRSGIHLAEYIRESNQEVPIIYLTSYYTEEHYELTRHTYPSSFLNKEISKFKLEHAIDIALMHQRKPKPSTPSAPHASAPVITHKQIFFKIGDVYKSIPLKEILYFYADNKLTYARVGNRNYPTNVQLKTLEDEFIQAFARIHKTYLVNIEHISAIYPKESSVSVGGENLPIGYAYRAPFLTRVNLLR